MAFAFGAVMLGSTLPTPLYPLYEHRLGFGSLLTTVIYAVYAAGVIAALLLFGQASDTLGRRRILLGGVAASALSAIAFLTGAGLPALFVGRMLSVHRPSPALAGTVVFGMFAGSALGQVGLARAPTAIALPTGCLVLIAGLAGISGALLTSSLGLLITATIVIGVGQSLIFRAGIAEITAATAPDERAQTTTSFFLVVYAGISVPVILVGVTAPLLGLRDAAIAFTVVVAALALSAMVTVLRIQRDGHGAGKDKPGSEHAQTTGPARQHQPNQRVIPPGAR